MLHTRHEGAGTIAAVDAMLRYDLRVDAHGRQQQAHEGDRWFWQQNVRYATEIGRAIQSHVRTESPTTRALEPFKNRITCALESLTALDRFARHDSRPDAMTLLRAMYDAHLQALYILEDPTKADERAQLFLDFRWIEQRQMQKLFERNPTRLAQALRESPHRLARADEREANFQRLRTRYLTRDGKKERGDWYAGNLRDLARAVGLESEYEILQKDLSGAVHSTPTALLAGASFSGTDQLLLLGWKLMFRVLGRMATHHGAPLSTEHVELVQDAMGNIYDLHAGEPPQPPV